MSYRTGRTAVVGLAVAAGVLLCLAGPGFVRAAEDELPKGEAVVDKYVEATGGKAAYEKITNRVSRGTFEIVDQGLKFDMTVYAARPNKFYSLLESESFGKVRNGTDGQVVWEITAMRGPRIKQGDERALAMRSAPLDAPAAWRELFEKAECVGTDTVDDKPCYKVVMTPKEGPAETRFYERETGLLAKVEMTLKLPFGDFLTALYPSDYKAVDGILLPHKARQTVMGSERIVTTESIEHNVEMPADRFELPDEIQELVRAQKGERPATTQSPAAETDLE